VGAVIAVFLGGTLGTGLRLLLDSLIVHHDDTFPVSTLLINVVGSFVLGILISRLWPAAPAWLRAGLGPGLLGGFTTFSAVVVAIVTLNDSGHPFVAALYLLATVVFGFGAAALGLYVGRRWFSAGIEARR
jgi:CrcB protein